MSRLLFAIILVLVAATAPVAVAAPHAAPRWEVVETGSAPDDDRTEAFDVAVRDGMVYIRVNEEIKVEIFSILGQLVTSRRLQPGVVRLTLPQKGVYILRAGGSTRRINV